MLSDNDRAEQMGQATREKLNQFIARIERLETDKAELAADLREVYAECKTFGFDSKIIRKVVRLRKMEAADREEEEALLEVYMNAIEI